MNQSNSIQRTLISFFLAIVLALVSLGLQNNSDAEPQQNAEASVYPKDFNMQEK